ncbi:MAG: hypothetical protein QXM45_01315 [Archaeoglobaceae archaeon]
MRSSIAIIAILILSTLFPAEGKTEALIYLDKEKVSVGDYIRVDVSISFEKPSPIEVLIASKSDAIWLCKNESKVSNVSEGCGATSWSIRIPENWESGDCYVKVNVHEGSSLEFSKVFKVIRPKIVEAKVPELVYQGKKKVTVKAEIADPSKAKLHFRLLGFNSRLDFQSDFDKDGIAKFEVNLRDVQNELKPGYYIAELKLFYDGKLFDTRSLTVEIVSPKLSISFSDEVKAGDPLRVEVSTNRDGDAEYSGIFIVLVGKNYKAKKFVELGEDGKARITFETAGLDEGYYTLYARDTSLTLRNIDLRNFSNFHYALDPSESIAKFFYAHDDVLVFKTLRIVREKVSKPAGFLVFEPFAREVNCGDIAEFEVFLLDLPAGISSYELRFLVFNSSVAQISEVVTPSWANDVYKAVFNESARVRALDIEDKVRKTEKLLIAKVKVLGVAEGSTEINVDAIQLSDDEGNSVVAVARNAMISVNCRAELQNLENTSIKDLTNKTMNEIEPRNAWESLRSLEQDESREFFATNETLKEAIGKIPKPKELGASFGDLFLTLAITFAFATTLLGRRLNSKSDEEHGSR